MPVTLYYMSSSPPCLSIVLLAKTLGVDLNLVNVDLTKQEQLADWYVKLNPQHTIPTLDDNGFVLWESRAILVYLVEKYGKDDSLYPTDAQKRAVINQRLYFDMGTFYQSLANYYYPQAFEGKPAVAANLVKMEQTVELFETLLDGHKYAAGDSLTLADYALALTVCSYEQVNFDIGKYANVARWYRDVQKIDGWKDIAACMKGYKALFANVL